MRGCALNALKFAIVLVSVLWFFSCEQQELDEYGGYYNETLGQYVYVRPGNRSSADNTLGIKVPSQGIIQTFKAKIDKIEGTETVWITIDDRQGYMILAQKIVKSYKNDKTKSLKIRLQYVKPGLIKIRNKKTKNRWLEYVNQNLDQLYTGKTVTVQAEYLRPGIFKGLIFVEYGDVKINLSLWMISEGFSPYFKEYKPNPDEDLYVKYQNKAESSKKGLWKL